MKPNDLPLSHGQRALWFLQRLRPEAAAWNIAAAARVRGRLDSGRLRCAFERLTERHDALRLSFHETPDGPVQRLCPGARLDFREQEWEEGLLATEAERPFDLEGEPLLRVRLLRAGGDDILLLVIHHLVADLGSLALIVRELGPLYDGTFDGPPPTPYSAFVERPVDERHWEYWRKRLAGELPVCELPADRPRPAARTFRGGTRTRWMDLQLPAGRAFPFLVAGLGVLLHRASGQTDLLVGSPTSGRLSRELDGTVGYLVNPVVLRSDLSGSPTFGQLVERMRGMVLGALRHQEYPFPLLVERLQPERDPSRPPVFQVMLAFQRAHLKGTGDLAAFSLGIEGAEVRTGSLVLESLALERRFAELDLELLAAETSRGLELALTFDADQFEPVTAQRLLGHLAALLEAAARDPELRIGELPLLSEAERHHLLAELLMEGNDACGLARATTVPRLFEEQAARTPEALAVLCGDCRLTYAELDARADALAGRLLGQGARPETCVAVLAERSPDLVVALLAILKSGAAYAPLDPGLPAERLTSLLADLKPAVVLTREPLPAVPCARSRTAPLPDSLAYVLYTSGSTGLPKPVGVTHAALAEHIRAMADRLDLGEGDRALCFASPVFDVSLEQILTALICGAAVVLRGPELWPPADFSRIAGELKLTVADLPTAYWRQWVRETADAPAGLRLVTAGGEAMPAEEARIWLESPLAGVRLLNAYGPTEGVITATTLQVDTASAFRRGSAPLGRPLPGRRACVVDLYGQPQSVGAAGELCLGGSALARGYLGRPELTAERFVPDSGSPVPGGRLYRTGDLARRLPDGTLEYLGRLDRQIKVRGVRIEPGEVEAALLRHPAVREAAVDLRPGPAGEPVLAAWVAGISPMPDLRPHLRRLLPEALVPAVIATVPALPLTAGGKVDRKALALEALPPRRGEPGGADTPLEDLLAGIWSEVLRRERVLPGDDFFELGGHSLLATQVVSRVRRVFGVELPLRTLFEEPTLAGLARRLREIAGMAGLGGVPPVTRVPREGRLPLSYAQERLWFLHRLAPGSPAYGMPGLVHVAAGPGALQACLSAIAARHETLRTAFPEEDGEPWQEIAPPAPVALPVIDLAALPDPAGEARRLAGEEARRPFDLARGPLLRALFLRLGREEHRLFLNLHHAVADGGSLEILARELAALLRGEVLPELPVQYADYAVWERGERARSAAQLGWWLEELAGDLPPLELPLDRPRPPRQRHRGASLPVELSAAAVHGLRRLARAAGATPFMVLLAAFQILLHRLSGQHDVRVGVPAANRDRSEIEGLIGLFVNTLVLRSRFGAERGLRESVESVRRTAVGAFLHQDVPYARLVDELQPERDPSRTPLFQAMLALQPPGSSPFRIEEVGNGTAKLELTLSLREAGDRIEGWMEHDTDLFDRTSVLRWIRSFRSLLDAGTADPERPVVELPLLGPEETGQILREWNDTRSPFPETCVHLLFDAQAERSPDAVALSCGGVDLSYRELAARADRLADRLRRLGAGPEVAVGLSAERSIEAVVGLLGILKAGGHYVPLDPAYPRERLDWMIEDSGVQLVLAEETLPEAPAPAAPALPESLAYTLFTSGSTGRPKGVQVSHRALVNFLAAMAERVREGDVLLAVTTLAFDIAALEILLPLTVGARVVVASREAAADGALLAAEIERSGATVLQATPSTWRMLVESGWAGSPGLTALCGGEALPRELARALLSRTAALWNLYGPTETTVWSAAHPVGEADRTISIGRPLANTSIQVVDRDLRPVPVGVAGELLIGGAGVARGYAGRPDLTAERFLPDPFGEPGARLYRTGDLARRLPDGRLEVLGRLDHQVKVRGFRVELEEVEAALEAHPAVSRAVAAVRDGRLAAYVVGGADPAELRAWLARRLPGPMIPSLVLPLDALPLTPNGKVDRRALPEPGPAPDPGGEAPATPAEAVVAEIWAQVLGVEGVGRHRSFFELGGHSLLATRAMARINEAFGTALPLRALFESPTVAGLALLAEAAGRDRLPLPPLRRVPRGGPLLPSFAQERLWVLDRLAPGSPVYNVFQALDLDGPLDEAALERAFGEAVRRHEALRTTFTTVQGRPMQVVEPHRPRPLPVVDLRGLPADLRQGEADRLARDEARRPFDLLRGPLLRFALLRLGGSSRLLLNLHHAVCDGWSLDLLAREVAALYRGQPLLELPLQYADYADWQRRWPAELLDGQLAWWKERLAGLATLELPTDRPRPFAQSFRGGHATLSLPFPGGPSGHATPFLRMLAAWQILLLRLTGQTDVAVGSPVANRGRREIQDLVGFFANTLVLRADLSGDPSFREALGRVRETALSAQARQDLPFERLVAELEPERDLSRSPLFQVSFSVREALPPLVLGPGLRGRLVDVPLATSRFDLWLQAALEEQGWSARAEYASDLFDAATVQRWLGHLRVLLEGIETSPEARLSELPLLSRAERHHLLAEGNDCGGERRQDATVRRLFEQQAARTPDAVAVLSGDVRLTYAELDARADGLADRLLGLGVGGLRPEACAAVLAERSPDLIAALLAVFKAGAVYAPLDPELPAERLALLLDDVRPAAILVQERLRQRLPACSAAVVILEDGEPRPAGPRPARPADLADSLAYVLHTSGSTGRPKPVGVAHGALAEHVLAVADLLELDGRDRALFFASPSFDVSLEQLLSALVRGATVVVRGPEVWPPAEFSGIARSLGLTVAELPTAYWRQWIREPVSGAPPALRLVTAGGEAMPAEDAHRWLRGPLAGVRLLNAYGPTEAVVTASFQPVDGAAASLPGAVTLGRPLPGRRASVLDRHGRLQPLGAPGELCLGGRPLARGYLGRPDLTAERFVPDPGSPEPGARLYRTGDLVRRLPDGSFQFLGRIDRQVKVRGFRIEPGEIETALLQHPGVREAVVSAREDRANDRRLVAWYVPGAQGEEREPSPEQLRAWLRGKLPEFMVPAVCVPVEALPRTPGGKVDTGALQSSAAEPVAAGEAPRTPMEMLVAGIFGEVLGVGEVPRNVAFFDLGGNSLLATQAVTLIQDVLPVRLDLREVFARPTVARLAEILEKERRALPAPEQLAMEEILAELERNLAGSQM